MKQRGNRTRSHGSVVVAVVVAVAATVAVAAADTRSVLIQPVT